MTEVKVLISGKFDNQGSTTNESHWNLLCTSGYAYLYSEIQYLICLLSAGQQWILNLKLWPSVCYLSSRTKGNCWEKWLLGEDTSLVFTFSHRPKLKQLFQNDWCRQVFLLHIWMENSTIYVHSQEKKCKVLSWAFNMHDNKETFQCWLSSLSICSKSREESVCYSTAFSTSSLLQFGSKSLQLTTICSIRCLCKVNTQYCTILIASWWKLSII